MVQSSVADPTLRKGQANRIDDVIGRVCETALTAGNLLKWGTDPETQVQAMPALPSADPDAIMTASALTSSTSTQKITPSSFDGATHRDRIAPCRSVSITFISSNINDWNSPGSGELIIDIYGVDAMGGEVHDTIARPNDASATTYHTRQAFAAVTLVDVGECAGSNGTATMGLSNEALELSPKDYPGFAIYEPIMEPNSSTQEFAQYDDVNVLLEGEIAVTVEHAVEVGDDVYIRIAESGTDLRGQATGQDGADDVSSYARLAGAHFITSADADAVAVVKL